MDHKFKPESLMMSHGYKPELSEGAIKCPIFQTSTFAFKTAEEGKSFFEVAYGLREKEQDEELGLIYSRINNPNLEILENRLSLWDEADDSAVFESGMSAISTVLLEFVKPGSVVMYSSPTYGGTDHFIQEVLPKFGIDNIIFYPEDTEEQIVERIEKSGKADKIAMIYIETPANPTNTIIDIAMCKRVANHFSTADKTVHLCVDNTYMGPVWSKPLADGADLVVYSATKFIGGHSDLIAGAVLANKDLMVRIKTLRTFLGNMVSPHTAWLMLRSLETLKIRMEKQCENAQQVAKFLNDHEKIEKVYYLGLIDENSSSYELYKRQYTSPGAMISFDIKGGEASAFKFLNALKLVKLAVSLGSTESLAQHPITMTHCAVSHEERERIGLTDKLIRVSIGVEDAEDIIYDVKQALEKV